MVKINNSSFATVLALIQKLLYNFSNASGFAIRAILSHFSIYGMVT